MVLENKTSIFNIKTWLQKKKILLPIANMASKDSTRMELDLHCICRINIFVFFAVSFIYFFATLLQKSTAGSIISHESPQFIRLKINMCKEQQCKRMTQKRDFFFFPIRLLSGEKH